jgi:hypothetical protein
MTNKIFFLVLLPILLGTCIYATTRPQATLLFSKTSLTKTISVPGWITNNLPDGLWFYSLLNSLFLIWGHPKNIAAWSWFVLTTLAVFLSEFAQRFHFIRGTFDIYDLTAYLIALLVFISQTKIILKQIKQTNKIT